MKKTRLKLLGSEVDCLDLKAFTDTLNIYFDGNRVNRISKINSEFLLRSLENQEFSKTLLESDLNIADGVGVLWAAKYLSLPISKSIFVRTVQAYWQMMITGSSLILRPSYCKSPIVQSFPGQDCFYLMLETAQKSGKSIYFFGGDQQALEKAIKIIEKKFPKLKIAGSHDGYSDKGQSVVSDINKSKAEMLFVGLGSPEQEFWIRDNDKDLKNVRIAVGEGGTIDYIAGSSRRAPKIINKLGLEWLWRMFFSPNLTANTGSRLKRVWRAVPVFIFKVVQYKIKHGQQEI